METVEWYHETLKKKMAFVKIVVFLKIEQCTVMGGGDYYSVLFVFLFRHSNSWIISSTMEFVLLF